MRPNTLTIFQAAKLLTYAVSDIQVPSLSDMGATLFDDDDARYLFQTMQFRNSVVDAVKSGEVRAVDEFTLLPVAYWTGMPDTQVIRKDDFLVYAKRHGYALENNELTVHQKAGPAPEQPSSEAQEGGADTAADDKLASLFDPVSVQAMANMFPDDKWTSLAERAARNGLSLARTGRGMFNPYRAAIWWLDKQQPSGWDLARVRRKLANNLPARNLDSKSLLTGEIE